MSAYKYLIEYKNKFSRYILFHCFLKSLIVKNYRLRMMKKIPDEWYWADKLAMEWGYTAKIPKIKGEK